MIRLGTWSTIECPTQKQGEALAYLQAEFEKIGGRVRRVSNPHDFGEYPSFEIDYDPEIESIKNEEDILLEQEEEGDKEAELELKKMDDWHDKANEIEGKYMKKFEKHL